MHFVGLVVRALHCATSSIFLVNTKSNLKYCYFSRNRNSLLINILIIICGSVGIYLKAGDVDGG